MDNKNAPAFPDTMRGAAQLFANQAPENLPTGLTKREYFAGLALQGILSGNYNINGHTAQEVYGMVNDAVAMADHLLTALSTPQP